MQEPHKTPTKRLRSDPYEFAPEEGAPGEGDPNDFRRAASLLQEAGKTAEKLSTVQAKYAALKVEHKQLASKYNECVAENKLLVATLSNLRKLSVASAAELGNVAQYLDA